MSAPRKLLLSDPELLSAVEQGRTLAQIAQEYDVTPQAVQWRLQQLRQNLPAPAARRAEETVAVTFDCIAELQKNYLILDQLRLACLQRQIGPSVTEQKLRFCSGWGRPLRGETRTGRARTLFEERCSATVRGVRTVALRVPARMSPAGA